MCKHVAVPAHYEDAASWLCACAPLLPALPSPFPFSNGSGSGACRCSLSLPREPARLRSRSVQRAGWGGAFLESDTRGLRLRSETVGAAEPRGTSPESPRRSLGCSGRQLPASVRPSSVTPGARCGGPPAMENENSRIPVYSFHHPTTPFPSKKQRINKTVEPEFSKDPNFTFSSNVPADGVFKAKNQGLCRSTKKAEPLSKKTATTVPLSRYRLETELKTKNQLLEIAKQQLHSKLAGAQGTIKDLREKNEVLEEEVQKLKRFQDNCMVILESRNIDPATAMWKLAENDRNNFLEKQTSFQRETEEYAAIVGQVELLLDT
uniref:Small kinetochore-associated protein n=1 Tax=Chelonoidis abingdonii TaxID=106734 RepID=A0A8C0GHH0_CHEAB